MIKGDVDKSEIKKAPSFNERVSLQPERSKKVVIPSRRLVRGGGDSSSASDLSFNQTGSRI